MNLPIMDGWTVARTLRERQNRTPIIALTAHAMTPDRQRALDAGCDDYHAKPVEFDKLLEQIDEALLRAEESGDAQP
jgi:two-component system cell cycle response regulator DivK